MSLPRTLIAGALGCILSACTDARDSAMESDHPNHGEKATDVATSSPSQQKKILNPSVLAERELLAARGDGNAAMDVASHYSSLSGDQARSRLWLILAAENGSALAMHLLSGELFKDGGQVNCERAIFWLKRLSQQKEYVDGYAVPGFIEKEISGIQAAEEECQPGGPSRRRGMPTRRTEKVTDLFSDATTTTPAPT